MTYKEWADDYFKSSETLKAKIAELKAQKETASAEKLQSLEHRILSLYKMYLECLQKGRSVLLLKRRVMLLESLDSFAAKTNKDEPDQKIERMKKIMRIGIETELTKRQYDCLTMRYFEDKKVGEIADILFITPATVYKHLNKAIKRLRKCEKYL